MSGATSSIERVKELTKLLLKRMREKYGANVPAHFSTGNTLVSTICEHLRKSKLEIDADAFHGWRKGPPSASQPSASQPSASQPSTSQPSASQPSPSRTVGKRSAGSPRLAELPKRTCYEEDSEG